MARAPRIEAPGFPLHIVQRGNNRSACFFCDLDRRLYLKCLARAASLRRCDVHAYVLMSNHVHLLVTPRAQGATSRMLQDVGRRYVQIINKVHGRTGTLWEGRYKSSLVDTEGYLFTCHRYIELNPVRAGMVRSAEEYPWSSHRFYAQGRADSLITPHNLFLALGKDTMERVGAYRQIFEKSISAADLDRVRFAANKGCALGSEAFMSEMETRFGRGVRPPARGRPKKDCLVTPPPDDALQENLF